MGKVKGKPAGKKTRFEQVPLEQVRRAAGRRVKSRKTLPQNVLEEIVTHRSLQMEREALRAMGAAELARLRRNTKSLREDEASMAQLLKRMTEANRKQNKMKSAARSSDWTPQFDIDRRTQEMVAALADWTSEGAGEDQEQEADDGILQGSLAGAGRPRKSVRRTLEGE